MDSAVISRAGRDAPPGAWQRLLLALVAACVLAALGWAAFELQKAKAEARALKDDLAVAQRNERAAAAAARAVPVIDYSSRLAALEQQVTEAEKAHKQAAVREKELKDVIDFLKTENTAALETIKRLSAPPEPEPVPAADPAPPPVPETPPAKPPRRRRG